MFKCLTTPKLIESLPLTPYTFVLINFINEQEDLPLKEEIVQKIVAEVLAHEGENCHEVAINFVTTERICDLHNQFFDDPSPTDCISFPLDDADEVNYRVLGEIFVCPETAIKYATENQLDPYEETTLYIIHGLLHLMGYDDLAPEEIDEMRKAETKHLTHLKKLKLHLKD